MSEVRRDDHEERRRAENAEQFATRLVCIILIENLLLIAAGLVRWWLAVR